MHQQLGTSRTQMVQVDLVVLVFRCNCWTPLYGDWYRNRCISESLVQVNISGLLVEVVVQPYGGYSRFLVVVVVAVENGSTMVMEFSAGSGTGGGGGGGGI